MLVHEYRVNSRHPLLRQSATEVRLYDQRTCFPRLFLTLRLAGTELFAVPGFRLLNISLSVCTITF